MTGTRVVQHKVIIRRAYEYPGSFQPNQFSEIRVTSFGSSDWRQCCQLEARLYPPRFPPTSSNRFQQAPS